jgi:hypothetical protein
MNRSLALATGAALLLLPATSARLAAQEPVLEEFYGNGVHQYFSGNYGRAIADLDAAINAGSRDPRAYYFRGLAKLRAGFGGESDLQHGASLEASDTDQYYPVSDSLERIQGSTRQLIERYRSVARANAFAQEQRRNAARYQKLKEREQQVLRGPAPSAVPATALETAPAPAAAAAEADAKPAAPSDAVAKPAVPPSPVPEPPAAEDPFAEKVAAPAPPAPAPGAAAAPAADSADPFADAPADDMPAAKPPTANPPAAAEPELTDDPFGEPPPADAPAEKPAAAPADDPFATPPASPTDDPFGAPPADTDDPFGSP